MYKYFFLNFMKKFLSKISRMSNCVRSMIRMIIFFEMNIKID